MEVINREQIKLNRIPLPTIKTSYQTRNSDSRFKSAEKNYNVANNVANLRESRNLDTSMSDDLGLEIISDLENKGYSKGSITDLPTTCDTSKNSLPKGKL